MPVNCSCSPRLAELKEATGSVWVLLTKTDLSTVPLNLQPGPAWCEPRSGVQSGEVFLQQMWQRSEGLREEQELPLRTASGKTAACRQLQCLELYNVGRKRESCCRVNP